ncbi:oocyte zinc finger protein XlCOF7.2-like [Eleutherodactylus coqui]|uniref:oocyte zinc finger protein XlCOF7.2-like n=1 Tax=Eleutherodactylus coqui TaxID=57060 RepID=UPI0034636220
MDKEQNEITEILLNAALEMIYLLTGEDYTAVKKTSGDSVTPIIHLQESGGWSQTPGPITEPPPHLLTNKEKILELTKKMTELLTGEVPIRCQDVTIYFSMEEWEYIGGHRDLYKDAMMDDHQPLTSADGANKRNPLERHPHLYPQDCLEEDPNVLENQQSEKLINIKIELKDEAEKTDKRIDHLYALIGGNSPERRPDPLYSQDCLVEEFNVPESHQQGEDLTAIKMEQEEWMTGDYLCKSEVEEEIPVDVTTENHSEVNVTLSINDEVEDEDIPQLSPGENGITLGVHPGLHTTDLSYDDLNPELHSKYGNIFVCKTELITDDGRHTGEKSLLCTTCGKLFNHKGNLAAHERIHTGEKPYSCSKCGKCFNQKSNLVTHERIHTGMKYSCTECGKHLASKSYLRLHERIHKGEKQYSCSECGKCFASKLNLVTHERNHTGEKPYSCTECGKCFVNAAYLSSHQKSHKGEKPL